TKRERQSDGTALKREDGKPARECLFPDCLNFNGAVMFTNTSGVLNMSRMFFNAAKFNQSVTFDTSNTRDMTAMFDGSAFSSDLASWSVASVTNCDTFCTSCGLPDFTQCDPCPGLPVVATTGVRLCSCPPGELAVLTQCGKHTTHPLFFRSL